MQHSIQVDFLSSRGIGQIYAPVSHPCPKLNTMMRTTLKENAIQLAVTTTGRSSETLSVEFIPHMENNQQVTKLKKVRVFSTQQPNECVDCILLKKQLNDIQEKAVLRQIGLDLERFLKVKALGFVPQEISSKAYDRDDPTEVDDARLNTMFLDDLVYAIPIENLQSYLDECNLTSVDELRDLRRNLKNLKKAFTDEAHPTSLSGVPVNNAIRSELVNKYSANYNVNKAIVLKFIPLYL